MADEAHKNSVHWSLAYLWRSLDRQPPCRLLAASGL